MRYAGKLRKNRAASQKKGKKASCLGPNGKIRERETGVLLRHGRFKLPDAGGGREVVTMSKPNFLNLTGQTKSDGRRVAHQTRRKREKDRSQDHHGAAWTF